MGCYEFRTLLPDNATPLEQALEETLRQKYCALDMTLVQKLSDPWQCPVEFLPWLAFAESVDVWNDRWPEQTKRAVIANASTLHRRKGTTGGVRDALAALGVNMSMILWQDMEPEGEVGTASFELWINDNINPDAPVMVDSQMIRDIVQTVERNKRLSVHYELTLGVKTTPFGVQLACSAHSNVLHRAEVRDNTISSNTRPAGITFNLTGQMTTLHHMELCV